MDKLTDKDFKKYLESVRADISEVLDITKEKDINYGHQFVVELCQAKLTLNIYNGKKGLTYVFSGDSALEGKVRELIAGEKVDGVAASAAGAEALPRGKWAGSDESGKGDFFGPLVVSAVVVDNGTAAKLAAAGVKDCKLLSDKKILELEETIKANVIDFSVLELKPKIYNMRYNQVLAQGGKLNQLLGFGHVAALSQVLERNHDCHAALIDQFTTSTVNVRELQKRFPECQVRQQPKAEINLAVAAASVLARARFLRTMDELAKSVGEVSLPKGGGPQTTACARKIAQSLGKSQLENYVKLHFANYSRI
ncbi:MAG: ribonuclease HIII [Phascolarctobacterium sp.]|nr:ribonuclease HIII [Phascolarctobacterium sp.]